MECEIKCEEYCRVCVGVMLDMVDKHEGKQE